MGRLIYMPGPGIKFRTGVIGKVTNEPEKTISGAIVSFDDGADDKALHALTVDIEPVQDLHGYANPWPGGGGRNLLDPDGLSLIQYNEAGDTRYGVIFDVPGTYTVHAESYKSGSYVFFKQVDENNVYGTGRYITTSTETFTITVTITEGQRFLVYTNVGAGASSELMITLKVQVESGSSAASWSPYSNICPINGWNQAVITRTGKNLFDFSARTKNTALDTTTGQPVAMNGYYITPYIPVQAGKPIVFPGSGSGRRWLYDVYKNPVAYLNNSGNQVYTPPIDGFVRLTVSGTSEHATTYQIEYGTESTDYEPYQGSSVTIEFGGTIYGGVLDVLSGILTVNRYGHIFDGTEDFSKTSNRFVAATDSIEENKRPVNSAGKYNVISSVYPARTANQTWAEKATANYIGISAGSGYIHFVDNVNFTSGSTSANFKAYVKDLYDAGTPLTAVWNLREEDIFTIQLDPAEVRTLLGKNAIFADTGDVNMTYPVSVRIPMIIPGR